MAIDFKRNNLDRSLSPYLRQHAENPIWWQEWTQEALAEARRTGKKLLVSIGYSTCHWCHVMASEAFSDKAIADYLNEHYISIKVDREQRPDIDQYFMDFLVRTSGSGGWPLNTILSPDAKPIVAFTYIPVERRYGMPGMLEILRAVKERGEGIAFAPGGVRPNFHNHSFDELLSSILAEADSRNGGFGDGHKFPQCSTLLFLLSHYERYRLKETRAVIIQTLDAMMTRGLHDQVQGGFFRYCVDAEWTIPHFEKMLYDQAMLLWTYAWAYSVFKNSDYLDVIKGILQCLEETFLEDGLYISAHDADTQHHEGETYLWKQEELERILTDIEREALQEKYFITRGGNFEGKIHLVGRRFSKRSGLEDQLLAARRNKPQPFADRKIITSWNALVGVGLIMAYRATGDGKLLDQATALFSRLCRRHFAHGKLAHSSLNGTLQEQEFLEDAAALLLLATYIEEEEVAVNEYCEPLREKVACFRDSEGWIESCNPDFMKVPAHEFDHPVPASSSLAEMALLRCKILSGDADALKKMNPQLGREFFSVASFIADGHWHLLHTPEKILWADLPINTIQVRAAAYADCFEGTCSAGTNVPCSVNANRAEKKA